MKRTHFCGVSLSSRRNEHTKKKVLKTLNPKQETKGLILFFVQIGPHKNKKRPPCISPAHEQSESENEEREI